MATPNEIDYYNNQTLLIHAATTHLDWMGLKLTCCFVTKLFFNCLVVRRDNISHVTCRDVL